MISKRGNIYNPSFTWVIRQSQYIVNYRKAFSTTDVDEAICSILVSLEKQINELELAKILGFNIEDDLENGIYADVAELEVFQALIEQLKEFNLVQKTEQYIGITEDGISSLETGLKFKYFSSEATLYENSKRESHI